MVAAEPAVVPDEVPEVEPSFSDDEYGYVDDTCDEELLGDILRKKPNVNEYEHCCVIVFGIPVIGEERLPKLKNVLGKLFARINENFHDHYPVDKDAKTKGYCFVEYPTPEVAENATAILDGYVLDKNHTFSANIFDDLRRFREPDPNWVTPQPVEYAPKGDLWSWMQNEKCYDQFAVLHDKEAPSSDKKGGTVTAPHVSVYDFRKGQDPQLAPGNSERQYWTEGEFRWSPHGTYMASVHARGVCLWAGEGFSRFMRFPHSNVLLIDFSPNERYLVSYSPPENRWSEDVDSIRIFDVQTGDMCRGFSLLQQQGDTNVLPCWPYFQWSHDDKYVACPKPGGNGISIYETENFTLLDKKHITVDGLRNFKWSPARLLLAYYCEERTADDAPAEIGLLQIPSKEKLRAQRVFSVSEAELFWNKNGDRLAAHTERYMKRIVKTTTSGIEEIKYSKPTSHIEIIDARGKDVSVISFQLTDTYVGFGWEPAGDKFCVLVGNQHKTTPQVFMLDTSKHVPQLMSKFEPSERFNTVSWAPQGGWLVVFSASSSSGGIMFIDSNGAEPTRTMLVEYPGFNKGSWDHTGRYFAAAYTVGGGRMGQSSDTGYRIFTFQGKELFRKNLDRMVQFRWRPRPPVKLPDETIKLVRKNLKTTSSKFEDEDKRERGRASQEVIEKRRKVMKEFNVNRVKHKELYEDEADLRMQLREGKDHAKTDAEDLVEETITVPLTTDKVKIQEATIEEE